MLPTVVKQGGCLSPTLFSVYMNELIEILRKNNIGCRYGSEYMGVFCYADDFSLLCPSFTGIKEMLKTCEDYAMKHNILFNAKKSQMLTFDHKSRISVKPRQSLLSLHLTKSYVRTATRSTLKVEANLTQILNFKANFHTEFEPFFKKKIYANNGGHFKIVSIKIKN